MTAIELKSGDLTFASNLATKRDHIVRVTTSAYEDDIAALPRQLTKAARAARIADIDPKRKELWNATALCGVRGETSAWGNGRRYYWHPTDAPTLRNACKGCVRDWTKMGRPAVQGWDTTAKTDDEWPWELPFGWCSVPTVGHPWDVPPDGDIELVKDATGEVRGEHRVELLRWQRGTRIVRLVHHTDDDTYSARYLRPDAKPNQEHYEMSGPLNGAREACQKLMARGGY